MAPLNPGQLAPLQAAYLGAAGSAQKGEALTQLVGFVIGAVPGVTGLAMKRSNVFGSQEVDVFFRITNAPGGFVTGEIIREYVLVECKNLGRPMGARDIAWFFFKLVSRGRSFGIVVSSSGISGKKRRTAAQEVIAAALATKVHIIGINGTELLAISDTDQLVDLVERRVQELILDQASIC